MVLYTRTRKLFQEEGNTIYREEYECFTLFIFDLTPDMCEVGKFDLIKQGNIRLEIDFANTLESSIKV